MKHRSFEDGAPLMSDLYSIKYMAEALHNGRADEIVAFDLFYRKNPYDNGFAVAAGLEQAIAYIKKLGFYSEEIIYLKEINPAFDDYEFVSELASFMFTGDIKAVPEGTVVFPNEPLVRVVTRLFEAPLIEVALANIIGHQTLIATKSNRIVRAAEGRPVMEFGARRAYGGDAAIYGARAAIIGGCSATSLVAAGMEFGVRIAGTHPHALVMEVEDELEAFREHTRTYPDEAVLLVDTFDMLKSGVPNAITALSELLATHTPKMYGIRIDSGDLAYLSKAARKMLDEAGLRDAKIIASNDLDEYKIRDLIQQGAKIDSFGVGTSLVSGAGASSLGDVYKLAAVQTDGEWKPRIKHSENVGKITNPGLKKVVRLVVDGFATADLIMLEDEQIPEQPFDIFDPEHTWKRKTINGATAKNLMVDVFKNGNLVYDPPSIGDIKKHLEEDMSLFSEENKRLFSPHEYHVDLSNGLYKMKMDLLESVARKVRS